MSIIIPARGSLEPLAMCLEALRRQTVSCSDREVIVVDNGLESSSSLACRYPEVTLLREERVGSYAARNRGLAEATGEFIAFTDSDCIPSPGWLENALMVLRTTDATIVGGKIEFISGGGEELNCYEQFEQRMFDAVRHRRMIEEHGFAVTANLVAYRFIFNRLGGFDSDLRSSGDREWTQRAVASGERLRYCDDARVQHPRRKTLWSIGRKIVRLRGGMMSLAKKQGFQKHATLLWRFTVLDPNMYRNAVACSRGCGVGQRLMCFGGVMLVAAMATVETMRVLCGARGYRG